MTTMHVPLKFGLQADVVLEESDRAPYVPPPLPPYEHDERCGCEKCVRARVLERKGA